MKKKLLVLSASAILASNFIFDNSASAVVDVRENPYKSEAMNIHGQRSNEDQVKVYIESLEDLIHYLSLNVHAGYDEPEYKEAYDVYQKKFMAEMEVLNKIKKEQNRINRKDGYWHGGYWHPRGIDNNVYGLTYERYVHIFESLLKNRQEFAEKTREIQAQNEDLRRFDYNQKYDAGWEINQLENKIIMIGNTFKDSKPYAVLDMYNKLDVIVGISEDDRKYNAPRNKRMLEKMKEDLETVIDQFFEDAKLARPLDIQPQSDENKDNETVKQKLRDDAKAAKDNEQLRDPKAKERADKFIKAEEAAKAERAKKAKASQVKKPSKTKGQKNYKYKQLKKHSESNKELNIKEPSSKASDSTHVAPSTQPSHRILKQQNQENKNYSKNLPGMSGETNNFNVTHNSKPSGQSNGNSNFIEYSQDTAPKNNELNKQNPTTSAPVVKETITESNVVDIDQSSFYEKSGYKYGYSVEDTAGYTERDKRAIRRNYVREAEELVNKYVNSHSYQDRIAAQAKVKTLSQEQQKRLNQQIDKIYNGQ